MKTVALILRDHRDDLWQAWAHALRDAVAVDYHELVASQVGQHMVRGIVDDVVTCSQAETYELPALYRQAGERVATEASSRIQLGFDRLDVVRALQALRGAAVAVVVDAMAGGELPSFADTLFQLRAADDLLDALVRAVWPAG